jgi:hypothetical protein
VPYKVGFSNPPGQKERFFHWDFTSGLPGTTQKIIIRKELSRKKDVERATAVSKTYVKYYRSQ